MTSIRNLSKTYSRLSFGSGGFNIHFKIIKNPVYEDFNLELPAGLVYLLGDNGTGKTTLLNCIANYTNYEGDIIRPKQLAYLPEKRMFYRDAKIKDFYSLIRDCEDNPQDVTEYASMLNFDLNSPKTIEELSHGNQTKLFLLMLLIKDVELFLLDEPTDAMDIGSKKSFMDLISNLVFEKQKTVVISTHDAGIINTKMPHHISNLNELRRC